MIDEVFVNNIAEAALFEDPDDLPLAAVSFSDFKLSIAMCICRLHVVSIKDKVIPSPHSYYFAIETLEFLPE